MEGFITMTSYEGDGVSNHRYLDCLRNRLFRHRSKKTSRSALQVFVRGIQWWPKDSPHKGPVTRKMFHLMTSSCKCNPSKDIFYFDICFAVINPKSIFLKCWYHKHIFYTYPSDSWKFTKNIILFFQSEKNWPLCLHFFSSFVFLFYIVA